MLLFNSKALLSQWKPRDATVNYRNLLCIARWSLRYCGSCSAYREDTPERFFPGHSAPWLQRTLRAKCWFYWI